MFEAFDIARERLEAQYETAVFDPASGLAKDALVAELERHRAENPDEPRILTKAWGLRLLCRKGRIAPEPGNAFVGKMEHHGLLQTLRRGWWDEARKQEFGGEPGADPGAWIGQLDCASHICPSWDELLEHGAVGLRDRAATHSTQKEPGFGKPTSSVAPLPGGSSSLSACRSTTGVFHQAVAMVFDGVVTLIERFNALQPSPVLAALTKGAPATLHEALQLAYIYHELMELDSMEVRSMGRFDLLYNDTYLDDLKSGRLDRDGAKELLKYFMIMFFAKSQGKRFGKPFLFGPDPNEFSYLVFEAYHEMRIEDPKFHVRLAERTPKDFLEQVARCILDGCTSIVIVNDDRQIEMLTENGRAREDAENYVLIGCYEPAVQGRELNCSGASTMNLAWAVEKALAADGSPSFDALLDAYFAVLDASFAELAETIRRWERLWPAISPTPLLSGTMSSCMEKGLDISEAGADYNTSGCCCIGLADAADSLAVIEQLVYKDARCSLEELKEALAANWNGFEELRLTAQQCVPKWGNNDDRVDAFAVRIADFLGKRINHEPNARGGCFQAALYGILPIVQRFGKFTGALPNGRRAGEPLAINTGASVGMERNGVTSLINSVTKIDLGQFPNGTVLDIMLHPSAVAGETGAQTIAALIRSHFAQGGMGVQFNIFDASVLRAAQREPEKYANLQVRVCGWNVRFANLSTDEQNMFIAKAEAVQ